MYRCYVDIFLMSPCAPVWCNWVGWSFDICRRASCHPSQRCEEIAPRAIPIVKVRWRHRSIEKATWETEQEMREQFPDLFEPSGTSWPLLSWIKVLFSSGYCNDPFCHFSVLSSVHRLERFYSYSKSFITCWDWQIGHLVIRFVIVWALVFFLELMNLERPFSIKISSQNPILTIPSVPEGSF